MEHFWDFLFQLMKNETNTLNVTFIFLFSIIQRFKTDVAPHLIAELPKAQAVLSLANATHVTWMHCSGQEPVVNLVFAQKLCKSFDLFSEQHIP